jgi:hypothetical protein
MKEMVWLDNDVKDYSISRRDMVWVERIIGRDIPSRTGRNRTCLVIFCRYRVPDRT